MRTHRGFPGPRPVATRRTISAATGPPIPSAAGPRRRARRVLAAVVLAIILAGCQSPRDGASGSGPGGTSDSGASGPKTFAPSTTDPDTVVLQIEEGGAEEGGGSVPVGWAFSAMPELTVYADGRAVVPGPVPATHPGPALPDLRVEQLSEADLDALVAAELDAGLLGEAPGYGQPWIMDASTTFVTLTVDGRTYAHAAYALVEGEVSTGEVPPPGDSGLTEDQQAARARLAEFIATANNLVEVDRNAEPYVIEALGVMAESAVFDGAGSVVAPEAGVLPWPLDAALADMSECTVVDGADAQALLETLAAADTETGYEYDGVTATGYEQDGVTYRVWFRPLLPHESGCADLE